MFKVMQSAMEIDDGLDVFREAILLDQLFKEPETCIGSQIVNELSVNGLNSLQIQFKENRVVLSSDQPFHLQRARERLIINYEPLVGTEIHFGIVPDFLRVVGHASTLYRDQESPKKIYKNYFLDEGYMRWREPTICDNPKHYSTPLNEQIRIVSQEHERQLDNLLVNQFVDDKYERRCILSALNGSLYGSTKILKQLELFKEMKEAYKKEHAEELNRSLEKDLALVKKWGTLGEKDMRQRAEEDLRYKSDYLQVNAIKRKEWCLTGTELHQLRFFNLNETESVDFYNRSFIEHPISYGPHNTLKSYEHMHVKKGKPVTISPISINYSLHTLVH